MPGSHFHSCVVLVSVIGTCNSKYMNIVCFLLDVCSGSEFSEILLFAQT
jgi:hypothetical protein